jgi:hypothetical protein
MAIRKHRSASHVHVSAPADVIISTDAIISTGLMKRKCCTKQAIAIGQYMFLTNADTIVSLCDYMLEHTAYNRRAGACTIV